MYLWSIGKCYVMWWSDHCNTRGTSLKHPWFSIILLHHLGTVSNVPYGTQVERLVQGVVEWGRENGGQTHGRMGWRPMIQNLCQILALFHGRPGNSQTAQIWATDLGGADPSIPIAAVDSGVTGNISPCPASSHSQLACLFQCKLGLHCCCILSWFLFFIFDELACMTKDPFSG